MLILTRKIGEGIIIGDQIRIKILDIQGKQVRLGIEAPPHLVILRQEIEERLKNEKP